jgi:hypothetical protein
VQGGDAQPEIDVSPDPEQASHEIAALASLGPLDAQRVLEPPTRKRACARSARCFRNTRRCCGPGSTRRDRDACERPPVG